MKIACIINGQLRVKDKTHLETLNRQLSGCDVYIRTYPEYTRTANALAHKRCVIGSAPKVPLPNLYQYWTLQDIVRTYKEELLEYDLIFRYRTDLQMKIPNLAQHLREYTFTDSTFYAKTDWIYCCKPKLFIEMFENVYDTILQRYINRESEYVPIHWDNLIQSLYSGYGHFRNHWLNYPTQYFPGNFNSGPDIMLPNIQKYKKELEELNKQPPEIYKKIPVNTKDWKRRSKLLISTEKFIALYALQFCPILQFKMEFVMPNPHVRANWKL